MAKLLTTYTVTTASDGDFVYEETPTNGMGSKYFAPSPNDDLAGRPSMDVNHQESKQGLVASKVQFIRPFWDADAKEYKDYNTVNIGCIRPDTRDIDDVILDLEIAAVWLSDAANRRAIAEKAFS